MTSFLDPSATTSLGSAYDPHVVAPEPTLFDPLTVSLDPGISLVEASAGTGKTYNITQTVLRLLLDRDASGAYRVDGVGQILVVTFTNAATDELITRVRTALRDAVDVFAGVVTERVPANRTYFDLLDRYGAEGLERLREALASLDQLSIFTIHGFCKRVLEESALESGTPFDAEFLEDDARLMERVAQDWWRRTVYEDARLAELAVLEEWKWNAFLRDLVAWRRAPDTRLEPDEALSFALAALDGALAEFRAGWDAVSAAAFLDGQEWLSKAPLQDAALRRRVIDAGSALAEGDLMTGMPFVLHCTTEALREGIAKRSKAQKERLARVADEPCVRGAEAIAAALTRVRLALRVSCLRAVNDALEEEKARHHLLGFDDLLRRLGNAIVREGAEGQLARAIRRRYRAALIDEFQDTDPYQFPIFSTAFAGCPLFLIGDPKQAIYGFRGADIFAYMAAAKRADRVYTLLKNWRSTRRMVRAVSTLFGGPTAPFLYERIPFRVVEARDLPDPTASDGRGALHWWFLPPDENTKGEPAPISKSAATTRIHLAIAREIVRLLRAPERGGLGLAPGSIAVLVRTSYEGRAVQEVLRHANIPSILAGMGDILHAPELLELELVLRAIAAPHEMRAVRAALATEMWGMDAAEIHRLSQPEHERDWYALVERLAAARETWVRHGFMRMVQTLIAEERIPERLLAFDDGERRLTNLRHAIELLHTMAVEERLSPDGLLARIARERAAGAEDAERRELRLESDAAAVQIVTIHKSKGLEYDVVFCPGLWDVKRAGATDPVLVHLDDDTVVLDHGSPEREARGCLAAAEQLAEDLRLAYVALTRARYRCYVAWGPIANKKTQAGAWHSALAHLLCAHAEPGTPAAIAERVAHAMKDSLGEWWTMLRALVDRSGASMSLDLLPDESGFVEIDRWKGTVPLGAEPHPREPLPAAAQLESWRIASFTSLTAGRHVEDARDVSDAGEGEREAIVRAGSERRDDFMAFPAGRRAGVVLHELFERIDFAASPAEVRALVSEILVRERFAVDEHDERITAVTGMAARVLASPLPGGTFALRDVPRGATLREWKFHLPLGRIGRRTLADRFGSHGGELARRYVPVLRGLAPEQTHGFLSGVVDCAFEYEGRWYIVDWKSNHLGAEPAQYDRDGIERAMFGSHYVLQYHLYVTALHRFLRSRVPGYDYEMHMGGVWYAFLRGIDGSERGWHHDRPPVALIQALDALMDAGVQMGGQR